MTTPKNGSRVSGNGHAGQPVAIACRELALPVPAELAQALPDALPVKADYQWFSEQNWQQAGECLQALAAALRQERADLVPFFAGAIVDLYHRDRADRACSLVPQGWTPIREIPREKTLGGDTYPLSLQQLTAWSREIPLDKLSTVARVTQHVAPDALYLATYNQYSTRWDPLIYAQYGDWFVRLAEWG